jgi:transglutaminase-like putative cysteine protease
MTVPPSALQGRNQEHRGQPCEITKFLLCCFLLCCATLLPAQKDYAIANIPPNLLTNAQAVVRMDETTFEVTEADEAEMVSVFAVTILNKDADHYAQTANYESAFEKIKYIEGRVFDANGEVVRESKKNDIQDYGSTSDYEYKDSRIKALDLRYGQYPYTVEFKTKQIIKGFFRIPTFGIEHLGRSVQHAAFKLIAPADYGFRWKGINTPVQPVKTLSGDQVEWVWTFDNLAAKPEETYNPYYADVYSELIVAPDKVKINEYSGNFENWTQIGRFFYAMNKGRDQLSPNMQAHVTALTKDLPDNKAKIEALYHYLQENHRYISIQIGIGGWQTIDARTVEEKKYGDCKALSNYMKALLNAAGIPAYHALVFADSDGGIELYDDAPTPVFNHMILYVPGENIWLECTSNEHPTGYLGDFTANRQVLLLTPDGGKLARTPALTANDNQERNQAVITLGADGNAAIVNQMRTTCNRHDRYRSWIAQKKQPEIEKAFTQDLGFSISKINTLDIKPHKSMPETTIRYDVSVPSYATRSGKRMFIPLLKINPFRRTLPADQQRVLDLKINTVYTFSDTITIQIPSGFTVENIPQNKKIETEFGVYDLQIEKTTEQITVLRTLEIKPVALPATRYNEVRQFYLEILKMDGVQAVLVANQ